MPRQLRGMPGHEKSQQRLFVGGIDDARPNPDYLQANLKRALRGAPDIYPEKIRQPNMKRIMALKDLAPNWKLEDMIPETINRTGGYATQPPWSHEFVPRHRDIELPKERREKRRR